MSDELPTTVGHGDPLAEFINRARTMPWCSGCGKTILGMREAMLEIEHWKQAHRAACEGGDILRTEIERLREALSNLLTAIDGNRLNVGDVNEARAALRREEA